MASNGLITALIAHPNPDTIRFITTLLEFEPDIKVVATTRTGEETLKRVSELNPQVVLISNELPDMDVTKAILQVATRSARNGVILISQNEDPEFLRRCMQAGARFFLVMPFNTDQLVTSIRNVCQRMETERAARARSASPQTTQLRPATGALEAGPRTIAFFAAKGGLGKTTLAVNTAIGLRQRTGRRVALVDADPWFGDVHLHMNLKPEHTIVDYSEHIRDADAEYVRSILTRHESGVRVLPAPASPEQAEWVHGEHMKPLLGALVRNFDYIIVDCALAYDDRTISVLDAADHVMLITAPELSPIHHAAAFLRVSQQLDYARDKIKIILNRFDRDVGITVDDVESTLGQAVMFKFPSVGRQMLLAANMGQPFIMSNQQSEAGKMLYQIVDYIAGKSDIGAAAD